jgi:hypothetical protein
MLGGAGLDFANTVRIFHLYYIPNVPGKFGTADSAAQAIFVIECGLAIARFRPLLRTAYTLSALHLFLDQYPYWPLIVSMNSPLLCLHNRPTN